MLILFTHPLVLLFISAHVQIYTTSIHELTQGKNNLFQETHFLLLDYGIHIHSSCVFKTGDYLYSGLCRKRLKFPKEIHSLPFIIIATAFIHKTGRQETFFLLKRQLFHSFAFDKVISNEIQSGVHFFSYTCLLTDYLLYTIS